MSIPTERHAPTPRRKSASQTADELSILKANEDEAIELFTSDDPEEVERGKAMLESILEHESDLRSACNRMFTAANRFDVEAAACSGIAQELKAQKERIDKQEARHRRDAAYLRVLACSHLDHHFPDEKTHKTPFGNAKTVVPKAGVTNKAGGKLRLGDIPPDYEHLIHKVEVQEIKKVIDEDKILDGLLKGESYPFASLKKNTVRFY